MPTYDYVCEHCGHEFEEFQSITARLLKKCPKCERRTLQRLIGTGGGVIFKGSGFYQTDYRSESYKKSAEAEKKAVAASKDGKGKKESSPDAGGGGASTGKTKASSETPGKSSGSG